MEQAGFDGVALDEKVDIKKSSFTHYVGEKSCGCDQWNGQGCIFFCFMKDLVPRRMQCSIPASGLYPAMSNSAKTSFSVIGV